MDDTHVRRPETVGSGRLLFVSARLVACPLGFPVLVPEPQQVSAPHRSRREIIARELMRLECARETLNDDLARLRRIQAERTS